MYSWKMADNGSSTEQTLTPPLSTPAEIPVHTEYSHAPATAPGDEAGKEELDEYEDSDADSCQLTKRRKTCPVALEKIEEFTPSITNQSFSFTFDTKFVACGPEITPKFGSFNVVQEFMPFPSKEVPVKILESNKGGAEDETEIREESREIASILRVIEGVEVE